MASNPRHPHDTRFHPGGGAGAASGGGGGDGLAESGTMAAPSSRASAPSRERNTQWIFGADPPPVHDVREEAVQGEELQGGVPRAHQFGPMADGILDEIATDPALPVPTLREYSGFEVAMTKSGERMFEPMIVERELKWQREEALGDDKKAQSNFKDMILQQQHFRAFALMTPSTPYITIVHSIGKYFPPIEADQTIVKGQYIGFVGDRKQTRAPVPIALPEEVWEWAIPEVFLDYDVLASHYEEEARSATFFTAPLDNKEVPKGKGGKKKGVDLILQKEEIAVPFMLSLPSCVISELVARTKWTPYELLTIVDRKVVEFDLQVAAPHWKVMREWCLAAAHATQDQPSKSLMMVPVMAVTADDEDLHEWMDTRLNMTMGQRHFPSAGNTDPRTHEDAAHDRKGVADGAVGEDLATQVGRGIAMGFQTFSNAGLFAQGAGARPGIAAGGTTAGETMKIYSPDSIAAIKGFSGTGDINELQPIWATFQTTRNLDVQRRHIAYGMGQWARNQGVEIDRGIYFEQKTVDDIVNLRFNPGQGVAQFKSAEKGLSLLICRSRTPEEIERVREREQAEQLTQATRVLEEALKLQRGDPRAPASNYFELKLNITSYCALVHTLFGDRCAYYQALMRIRNCMDTAGVYNIRQAYTADVCHRITWAIIDDGRSFFSNVLIQQDFEGAGNVNFPESLLDAILVDVRFANPVMRASYPHEWRPKAPAGVPAQFQWTPPAGGSLPPPLPQARGGAQNGAPAQQKANTPWTDNRHPAIVAMMAPYITKLGDNVYVGEILDAAGIRLNDLPVPVGTRFASKDGKVTYLCWNAVLGRCKFGAKCKYKKNHPAAGELPDSYAAAVVGALQQGVTYVVSTKEASPKKIKTEVVTIA